MTTPPSKRHRSKEVRGEDAKKAQAVGATPDSGSSLDADPAGRLLHRLRDRGAREDSEPPPSSSAPQFGPGVRVRVLRGPFVGRSGIVQELDGRGGARVMLGLLSTRIDLKDLATAAEGGGGTRERLTLSSSHRKPR